MTTYEAGAAALAILRLVRCAAFLHEALGDTASRDGELRELA
jgi:hypothetical protein